MVCLQSGKNGLQGKTKTENKQQNMLNNTKELLREQKEPANRSFSATCETPASLRFYIYHGMTEQLAEKVIFHGNRA